MNRRSALQIRQTAAWCEHAVRIDDLATSTRTAELRPDVLATEDPHECLRTLHGNKAAISQPVEHISRRRCKLVRKHKLTLPPIDFCRFNGRFYCTDFDTDECQAATEISNRFFDLADIPGWDTWVAHDSTTGHSGMLYGWVPNSITAPVGRGMWAIPVESVWWVDGIPDTAK